MPPAVQKPVMKDQAHFKYSCFPRNQKAAEIVPFTSDLRLSAINTVMTLASIATDNISCITGIVIRKVFSIHVSRFLAVMAG